MSLLGMFHQKPKVPEITAAELKARLDAGEKLILIDVREPRERAVSLIAGSVHIPVGEVAQRLDEVKKISTAQPGAAIVTYCKGGVRSAVAADVLLKNGFDKVLNLQGGIIAWARTVEPGMPVG